MKNSQSVFLLLILLQVSHLLVTSNLASLVNFGSNNQTTNDIHGILKSTLKSILEKSITNNTEVNRMLNSNVLWQELESFTRPAANLQSGDLDLIIRILTILVNNSEFSNTSSLHSKAGQQKILNIFSNVLEPDNEIAWEQFEKNQSKSSKTLWNRLVVAIDNFGLLLASNINSGQHLVLRTKNIIMRVDKVGQQGKVKQVGLRFEGDEGSFICLPPDAFAHCKNECRVVSVIYKTIRHLMRLRYETNQTQRSINMADPLVKSYTTLVSSTVRPEPVSIFKNNVKVGMRNKEALAIGSIERTKCMFWRDGLPSVWKPNGCGLVLNESNKNTTTCECNHLTVFAALMDPYGQQISQDHYEALGYITTIGCAISLAAILVTIIVTLFLWKSLKSPRSIVMLNICAAIAVVCILVIAEGTARDSKVGCTVMAVLLHYFLLAVFCWMLCEGILLYLLVVKVIGTDVEEKIKMFYLLGWGFPALIVVTSLGITQTKGYGYYGYRNVCWLAVDSGLIWAFVAPAVFVLLVNLVVLVLVIRQMMSSSGAQNKSRDVKIRIAVKATAVLLPLLGITWLFGLLAFNSATLVFKYIFAIFNSLQGLIIFIFYCVCNKQIKDAVRRRYQRYTTTSSVNNAKTPRSSNNQRDLAMK